MYTNTQREHSFEAVKDPCIGFVRFLLYHLCVNSVRETCARSGVLSSETIFYWNREIYLKDPVLPF